MNFLNNSQLIRLSFKNSKNWQWQFLRCSNNSFDPWIYACSEQNRNFARFSLKIKKIETFSKW